MKSKFVATAYVLLLLLSLNTNKVLAQIPRDLKVLSPQEIDKAKAMVEAHPDDLKAHRKYIFSVGYNYSVLEPQYKLWMKKYPENVNFPLGIGTVYYNAEMAQGRIFLLKAANIEPKNAEIWFMLSEDADRRGQNEQSTEYLRKAIKADSSNAIYAFCYLWSFRQGDPNNYKQKVFEFVRRFPTDEMGAQALYWLGVDAIDFEDKIDYFEKLRKFYPPNQFTASSNGMTELADAYMQKDPVKALDLIKSMGEESDWKIRKQVAKSLIEINKLEQTNDYKNALLKLNALTLPEFNQMSEFVALKKSLLQEKSGDIKGAYDSLLVKFATLPTGRIYTALKLYAMKIGKNNKQISEDIEAIRNSTAVPAYPFELGLYTSDGKLNLKDLKGKVVLLTFWFPGCSPCRVEFPHFQSVLNKFKGQNVEYVGINVSPLQDPYVLPFMKNTRYSFIPLRGNAEFAQKNYSVSGEPENFLLDKEGKIVFKNFSINNSNHRTLELMISSLLDEKQQSN